MSTPSNIVVMGSTSGASAPSAAAKGTLDPVRLNYIGSKFQLLDWLSENILKETGWPNFRKKTIADLFGGTGIVSYAFRQAGATVLSNDAEQYSAIICHAFTRSCFTTECAEILLQLNIEINEGCHTDTVGTITTHYSPKGPSGRKFFTEDNAQRIDYLRARIEEYKAELGEDDYMFLLASLLVSADAVSNVPAVYGCFLKNFKDKALKRLTLKPIHTCTAAAQKKSKATCKNVLDSSFLSTAVRADAVYLDPPYNERQYSKNYFPLNLIAASPTETFTTAGVTGIPEGCFLSPFCRRGAAVEAAFETLFKELRAPFLFLSYNSESLISKDRMLELMSKYGTPTVVEREYKRFKSFEYNKDTEIKEYLFTLRKTV